MQKGDLEIMAVVTAVDGDDRLQIELGEALGRFRRRREQEITDRQAADLLPKGVVLVMQRQGCSRSTAYRRASRVSLKKSRATFPERDS